MATSRRRISLGQRLHDSAPSLYRTVGPAARWSRHTVLSALQARDARAFTRGLAERLADVRLESPRIVLDGCAFEGPPTGIARFWHEMLPCWSQSGFARHLLVLDRAWSAPRYEGFTYIAAPSLRAHDTKSQSDLVQAVCEAVEADVFVSTAYTSPTRTPSVLFLHDLIPEVLGWDVSQPMWREKARAIERANAFVCSSQSTINDLVRLYPSAAGKPATVNPLGVGSTFFPAPAGEVEDLRKRLGLPERYFVFVGHRSIHKNAELVFHAIETNDDPASLGLMLVGGSPQLEPEFRAAAEHVTCRIEALSDDDLRRAYSGAAALLYVSRYEGFGLAILEAMSCGCPVITCRNSSLPEAAGSAALFVDEDDPEQLRAAMSQVARPETRARLIAEGLEWSARLSWAKTASLAEQALLEAAR